MTTEKDLFSAKILEAVQDHNGSVLEAILNHCEKTGLEVEIAATLLNDDLKDKLEQEANCLNFLKKDKKKKRKKP